MKLNELSEGDEFTLVRDNEDYVHLGATLYFANMFHVRNLDCNANVTTLNGQCDVIKKENKP